MAKPEDNVLVGIMYSVETGEEDVLKHYMGPGLSDASFLSGIIGLRVLKTPESFATRTKFHVEDVRPQDGENMHAPLVLQVPLKHAR